MYNIQECVNLYTVSIIAGVIMSAFPYLLGVVINAIFKIFKGG